MKDHMNDDKKAEAEAAIEDLKKVRAPQPKTIFETVHCVFYSE